jgi:2-dehydro-3-deoxyphosphogluconate aldolase/(4S)-4-hydroxy-2-oxoglutarate aldolase
MERSLVLKTIKREKLVPVVRTNDAEDARKAVESLASCGIKIFEITMTVPNAAELIRELSSSDPGILLGAGTVLNREQTEKCAEAGARFIVSPAFDAETVRFCRENQIVVMPGCLTPTEVLTAWNAGADCVKVFPCDVLGGAKYLKTLKTLFPHIEMMPTGGVSRETIVDFFKAGAIAVGVGTDLVDVEAIQAGNTNAIAQKARDYLKIVSDI